MTVLFVIFTIILFLAIDIGYRRYKKRSVVSASPTPKPASISPYPVRTPEGIFFTKSHI